MAWIKAYKGFEKDMKCRDFQFEEGQEYEEQEAKLCKKGFHACETPVDCLGYYPARSSVFREVELDATEETNSEDTKRVGKRIKIGAEIDVAGIVKAHFEYRKAHCTNEQNAEPGKPASAGACGAASAGAYGAASAGAYGAASAGACGAASAGESGAASAGFRGAASAGACGAASAGESGAASAGFCGAASAGESGAASAGESGAASAGFRGAACSRGSVSVGENGIACVRGNHCTARGGLGAVLLIGEEKEDSNDLASWKAVRVDGKKIKADTWYKLENGKFVEAKEGTNL